MNQRTHGRYADFQEPYEPSGAARPPNEYGPYESGPYESGPPPRRRGTIKRILISVLVVLLVVAVGTYFWADSKLRKEVDLGKVIDRPAEGEGTNYLIVGSDSRKGMSAAQRKSLHTGGSAEAGQRTDSMMILHIGSGGPTLISLPRDSNVTIPQFRGSETGRLRPAMGANKLNAAYAFDGPQLLVRTVEYNTGLHIDHYAEIGFTGFANIVEAMGGVEMNLDKGFTDKWSGADFKAGKQTLNGAQALAFVRTRHAFATSDLQRTKNQQKFLSALANQAASPGTVLNPFALYPVMSAGLDTLVVDKDMNPYLLARMFLAMKDVNSGDGRSMNMPVSGSVGGNLQWDRPKVKQLVNELKSDEPVTVTSGG
ncbi:LCP family protein [Streptomyces gilvosporeus]|uniref:Transcriptional regulator n=1 Tax=Streptomyces gilvosporeus TaxID=553510 RepID=A0A1V0TUG5_9ACTN|nr:LCP family protein [Streptomyces gilvosporeus]ARF56604.1 transcriptional regulator [Streptomyces gilvosporeus]